MKVLNIIVACRNKVEYLNNLINGLIKIPSFKSSIDLFIVDDNSEKQIKNNLEINLNEYSNISLIRNDSQLGKIKSILKCKDLIKSKYILTIDDKDSLTNPNLFALILETLSKNENDEIFVAYYQNIKANRIGDLVENNESYSEFYFKNNKSGDHLFFIPTKIFETFYIPDALKDLIINDELVYYQYMFNLPNYNFKDLSPLFIHDYTKGNLTKNIFENKIKNYQVTLYCAQLVLKCKPTFKITLSKLLEIFLIRKKTMVKFSYYSQKLLYWILYLTGSFIILKKIYLRYIDKLVSGS